MCGRVINSNPVKEELNGLDKEQRSYQDTRKVIYYTDKELLNYLTDFYRKNGRVPTQKDFTNNPEYPSFQTYSNHFGSLHNALKLVGLDVDSMVKKGVLVTNNQKARLAEIKVINHFKQHPTDLAGENPRSPCDGICPNGKTYDVKGSKLYKGRYYNFNTKNKYREEIEIYYFLGFNEDFTELQHAWRVPGEMVDKGSFAIAHICVQYNSRCIESMKEYDITDRIKEIF
jgi:Homing endonuclease associated repeat